MNRVRVVFHQEKREESDEEEKRALLAEENIQQLKDAEKVKT